MTRSTITVMLALAASVLMSACAYYAPPRAEPAPAHKGGNFCPPGQAKKGNC